MAVQDDVRENELRILFGLKDPEEGRSGNDAILILDGRDIPFELKSTTRGSVTTVRDFGPDHIEKWTEKHWLIGFYNRKVTKLEYSLYGSPNMMKPWIDEKAKYVKPDYEIAECVANYLTKEDLFNIAGRKDIYTIEDAKLLQKKQYNIAKYRELMDVGTGYTHERMLEILKDRCGYLLKRGATLNNPHIPESYFAGWEKITENHANRLRELVREAIQLNA